MTLALFSPLGSASAAEQHCERIPVLLWGDGKHDDTSALNAWLRGAEAVWADTGRPVGPTISGRAFRLSEAIYVRAGTGRTLYDFRLEWPERGETVTGGAVHAGTDPDSAPALTGVSIVGGDPGEGVPFEMPDLDASESSEASCATS
jgi:hypothetical protein